MMPLTVLRMKREYRKEGKKTPLWILLNSTTSSILIY